MKIRSSFVTNSSSSSFILAAKKDINEAEIKNVVKTAYNNNPKFFKQFFNEGVDYCMTAKDGEDVFLKSKQLLEEGKLDDFENILIDYLVSQFKNKLTLLDEVSTLDSWVVDCDEYSNEDESLFRNIVYSGHYLFNSDNMRFIF